MKETNEDKLDLRRILSAIRKGWWWYAIAAVALLGLAGFYWVYGYPVYTSNATMLVEDDQDDSSGALKALGSGGAAALMKSFSLGGGLNASNVDNEALIANSIDVFAEAVERVGMNRAYVERVGIKRNLLYKCSPVLVDAPKEFFDTLKTGFKVKIHLNNGKVSAKATAGFLGWKNIGEVENQTLPCALDTKFGKLQLLAASNYDPKDDRTITVAVSGNFGMAHALRKDKAKIGAGTLESAIFYEFDDIDRERGIDFLNAMMQIYNERRLNRKNESAQERVDFVDKRIAELAGDLRQSEDDLESFKLRNNITDIGAEAEAIIKQGAETRKDIVQAHSQLLVLDMVDKFLANPDNKYKMIPMSESLGDPGAAAALESYNELIARRMNLERSAKGNNVALTDITTQIDEMRSSVVVSVARLKDNTKALLNTVQKEENKFNSRLGSMPKFEKEYFVLMRDKELKNSLYVFLLEKRESARMKLMSTTMPGFVIEHPYCDPKPNKTKKIVVLIIAIMLILIAPTLWILVLMRISNKVHELFDLPAELEPQAVHLGESDAVRRLRGMFGNSTVIYVKPLAGVDASPLVRALSDSYHNIEVMANIIDASENEDAVFAMSMLQQISATQGIKIVTLPASNNVPSLDAPMVIAVKAGETSRAALKGIDCTENTYCAIIP